ncbi:MAG: cation diffusion facilitator family transporter [Bacillota bacterium]|nr:cation diffusion facilitator family transporter [Bacillota bacterium]
MSDEQRFRRIRRVLIIILVLNWSVALAKVIYGIISRSASMTADGYHSLADGASNIVGLIGIGLASRPPDDDHPLGHKKYETFAALAIAGLLALVSFDIIERVARRLLHPGGPGPEVTLASFAVMLTTLVVNFGVMTWERRQGRALQSDILVSDSFHTMSDLYVSLSVIATLVAVKLGWAWLDVVAALVISGLILRAAVGIVRRGSDILCDTAAMDARQIEQVVATVPGVRSCHRIVTRGREDDLEVTLHVQVDPDMHVEAAHGLAHEIELAVRETYPGVSRVISHVEPFDEPQDALPQPADG